MEAARLPEPGDKLGWLAIMQHYGAPTRLLDFTYSPYVALYFALRNRIERESDFAEVWGLDAAALRAHPEKTSREADDQEPWPFRVSSSPEDASTLFQQTQIDDTYWDASIRNALNPWMTAEYLSIAGALWRKHYRQSTIRVWPVNKVCSSLMGLGTERLRSRWNS